MMPIKYEDGRISALKELAYDEFHEPVEKKIFSYNISEIDWEEYLAHFAYVVSGIKDYKNELTKKHSDIDQKISDILHYIELCETDSGEAADLVELLRVCHENRRDVKDEMARVGYFQVNFGTKANAAKAKQALKSIKGLASRKYKPRKYEELFENGIMKNRIRAKKDIEAADFRVKQKWRIGMAEERNYTPYDGRANDWILFARQQAEFYRNAGRYITNLQIAIDEIDKEIEDILQEAESASCNAAQGYKVFKRLKELRLERKAKLQELGCLYALTDCIDCDAFADKCESSLAEIEKILNIFSLQAVTVL